MKFYNSFGIVCLLAACTVMLACLDFSSGGAHTGGGSGEVCASDRLICGLSNNCDEGFHPFGFKQIPDCKNDFTALGDATICKANCGLSYFTCDINCGSGYHWTGRSDDFTCTPGGGDTSERNECTKD